MLGRLASKQRFCQLVILIVAGNVTVDGNVLTIVDGFFSHGFVVFCCWVLFEYFHQPYATFSLFGLSVVC